MVPGEPNSVSTRRAPRDTPQTNRDAVGDWPRLHGGDDEPQLGVRVLHRIGGEYAGGRQGRRKPGTAGGSDEPANDGQRVREVQQIAGPKETRRDAKRPAGSFSSRRSVQSGVMKRPWTLVLIAIVAVAVFFYRVPTLDDVGPGGTVRLNLVDSDTGRSVPVQSFCIVGSHRPSRHFFLRKSGADWQKSARERSAG